MMDEPIFFSELLNIDINLFNYLIYGDQVCKSITELLGWLNKKIQLQQIISTISNSNIIIENSKHSKIFNTDLKVNSDIKKVINKLLLIRFLFTNKNYIRIKLSIIRNNKKTNYLNFKFEIYKSIVIKLIDKYLEKKDRKEFENLKFSDINYKDDSDFFAINNENEIKINK